MVSSDAAIESNGIRSSMISKYLQRVLPFLRPSGPLSIDDTAKVLHYLLFALFTWYGFWVIVLLRYSTGHPPQLTAIALIEAALFAALVKLRLGSLRAASWIYLAGIWLFATLVAVQNGGIRSVILALYVTLPVSAAWLLGYRASLWTTAVCLGSALIFAMLETAGVRLPRTIPGTPIGLWVQLAGAVLMGVMPLVQVLRSLNEALQPLHLITDNMEAAVTRCSSDLRYLWASRSYAAWLGRKQEEIAGHPIVEIIGREGFEAIRPHVEKVLSGEREEYEGRVNYGGVGPRWIHAVYVPTKGQDHKVDGWIAVIADVTEPHEAEATLRASEERFRNMADSAPVALWVTGPDGLVSFYNRIALKFAGRTMAELEGSDWIEFVHPDDRSDCQSAFWAALAERSSFRIECRVRRADGEYRWVLCSGVPRFSPEGVFAGFLGTSVDITGVKRVHEAAIAAQKLESLGTLASGIAHDFNNLLGSVLALAELALWDCPAGSKHEAELIAIRDVAMRGSEIVRQLMIYAGKESAVAELVDFSTIVEEMLELLKVSVSKHAVLEVNLNQDLPPIRANGAQLRQVVMNLVTNASEAVGDRDGVIRVTTKLVKPRPDSRGGSRRLVEGDWVQLEVSDTGRGMSPETQAKMFDPFFTTKSAGHGLGLAVVQGIVRDLGGSIHLVSDLGKGTTFQILLPCAETTAGTTSGALSGAEGLAHAVQDGTVLIVEDEGPLRKAVGNMLRMRGFEVLEAADGSSAIDLLRTNRDKVDVILLDMTIPGAPSSEVVAEAAKSRPEIRVVLTSAYSQEIAAGAMSGPQVQTFIRKPFQIDDLVKTLRSRTVLSSSAIRKLARSSVVGDDSC